MANDDEVTEAAEETPVAEAEPEWEPSFVYALPGTDAKDPSIGGPVHVDMVDRFGERFELDLKPGKHTPKSEREEDAFEHLVMVGFASRKGR